MNTSVLHFGRVAPADVRLDWDKLVSTKHFSISREDGLYILQDLGSRNGTCVNSKPVRRWQLQNGDRIQIGSSELIVYIGQSSSVDPKADTNEISHVSNSSVGRTPTSIPELPPSVGYIQGNLEECGDGLVRIQGAWPEHAEDASWIQCLGAPGEHWYAIIDASRSRGLAHLVSATAEPRYFLDWFPDPVRVKTPAFVSLGSAKGWQDGLMDGWDCNAILLMRSTKTAAELFDCMKHLLQCSEELQSQGKGMHGFCWPSILQTLLTSKEGDIAEQLLKIVEQLFENTSLFIIENEEAPLHWQLFARRKTVEPLLKTKIRIRSTQKFKAIA